MKNVIILLITLSLFSCGNNFNSKDFETNTELAKAYFQLHEEENAEAMFEFLHPDMQWHLPGYGSEMGNIQDAASCYEKAIEADPKYAPSYFNKGVLLDKLQEHQEALDALEKAIQIDSRKTNALIYRGIVLGKMKRHEEALTCFENICKKFPNNQDAFFQKGIQLAELGRHEDAIIVFDDILKKFKDNVNVTYAKSRSKAALGEFSESLNLLKQVINKQPKVIRNWAKEEPIFSKMHSNAEFRRLVKL